MGEERAGFHYSVCLERLIESVGTNYRVALVTGGHRVIGLEMALALAEAGAVVYCLDLPAEPSSSWKKVQSYVSALPASEQGLKGRLEYLAGDVTDQKAMWAAVEGIVEREGRIDICMANAGIWHWSDCLEYSAEDFKEVHEVNVCGVLFAAQAAGRQMVKLGIPGSITQHLTAYNSSKSVVLQMTRSLACELAPKKIRVNSISPGYIVSDMTRDALDEPGLEERLSAHNPMNRLGCTDELRGVALFLASDASSFCTGADILIDGGQCLW
ncbi:hypothetical protein B0H11DRAFT_2375098 [Mycena galericulata]|nr:hypothetical protein B0H11DRAFT_2375098 [Mycena galericulata]